eukprot:164618-Prymnesium_polylepis.2
MHPEIRHVFDAAVHWQRLVHGAHVLMAEPIAVEHIGPHHSAPQLGRDGEVERIEVGFATRRHVSEVHDQRRHTRARWGIVPSNLIVVRSVEVATLVPVDLRILEMLWPVEPQQVHHPLREATCGRTFPASEALVAPALRRVATCHRRALELRRTGRDELGRLGGVEQSLHLQHRWARAQQLTIKERRTL